MNRDTAFGSALTMFGVAGSFAVTIFLTKYPHATPWVLYVSIGVCVVSFMGGLIALTWRSARKDISMEKRKTGPVGIYLKGCQNATIRNCQGENLSTFIRAKDSRNLRFDQNFSNNTDIFMDLDNVSDVTAAKNIHNAREEGPRRYTSGWRPPMKEDKE